MKKVFDVQSSFTIPYHNEQITVWPLLKNNQSIVIDLLGNIYSVWWPEPENFGNTPHQRNLHKFKPDEIRWKKFENGLVSFQRGLLHAITSGEKRILSFVEWEKIVKSANTKCMLLQEADDTLRNDIQNQFKEVSKAITKATSKPLKEANQQLALAVMFVDSLGRFNVGVVQCRNVAVYERLTEMHERSNIWNSEYANRLEVITSIHNNFLASLVRFKIAIKKNMDDLAKNQPDVTSELTTQIDTYINHFIKWIHVKPYNEWVKKTIDDLNAIKFRIAIGDIDDAQKLMQKVYAFTLYKELQQPIDKMIYDLSYKKLDEKLQTKFEKNIIHIIEMLFSPEVLYIVGMKNVEKLCEALSGILKAISTTNDANKIKKSLQIISNMF